MSESGNLKSFHGYIVTQEGHIYSRDKSHWLKQGTKRGYKYVTLFDKKHCYVHRLVAELYIPNPENLPVVDHINRDRGDNRVCNLRWTTQKDNCRNCSCNHKVQILETGSVYNSLTEAAEALKCTAQSVFISLKKGYKCRGYNLRSL